ncbi:MAG: DUF3438 family protein [Methyloprofundus sp.]|nr:DUF3438 family protein [Methyloprofundus sp.]
MWSMFHLRSTVLVCILLFSFSAGARNKISELDFKDISVGDALRILSKQSNLNFISSKAAAKIEMTMFLRNIEPMDVLDAMAKTYNLWYQKDKKSKVIRIYTVREFRLGKVDYHNEKTEIFTFKHQRTSLDFAYMIQDLFGFDRVMLSRGADESEVTNDLYDRMERFDIIARNTYNQSGDGGESGFGTGDSGGSGNGNSQNGNNNNRNGNSRNTSGQRNNRGNGQSNSMTLGRNQAFDLSRMLPAQEASSMLSGAHDLSSSSVDMLIEHISPIYVTIIRRQNRVLVRTRDKDALQEIQGLFKKLDIDMATLLLEVKVLQIALGDGFESSFEFNFKSGDVQVTRSSGENLPDQVESVSDLVRAGLGDPAMVAAMVSKNFDARLTLLENEGRVTALATPMLTTTNQEVSRIFIGEERPITTEIKCGSGSNANAEGNNTIVNCTLEATTIIRAIGKTLLLTPNINADGTVDIRILVEDSTVCEGCGSIPSPTQLGALQSFSVDTVQTQTFSGNIIAQNAQMIAVGGLINERTEDIEKKVPIMGDIPYLGFFFRDTRKVRSRTEMVILIRPYVMNNQDKDIDVNQPWLEANSIHPSADNLNHLDVYKNSEHLDKGYTLQPEYKIYPGQDKFDGYNEKGIGAVAPKVIEPATSSHKQATYMQLTEYAAKSVRLPIASRETVAGVVDVPLPTAQQRVDVLFDMRLNVVPVASWRKGGVYVTAVEVRNLSNETVEVDYRNLKGNWLASTIETEKVAPHKAFGDVSYLYLISGTPFEQALEN